MYLGDSRLCGNDEVYCLPVFYQSVFCFIWCQTSTEDNAWAKMVLGDSRLRGNDEEKEPLPSLASFPRRRESCGLCCVLLNKTRCSFLQLVCERDSSGNPLPIPIGQRLQ